VSFKTKIWNNYPSDFGAPGQISRVSREVSSLGFSTPDAYLLTFL
jgi:hypothetical protein